MAEEQQKIVGSLTTPKIFQNRWFEKRQQSEHRTVGVKNMVKENAVLTAVKERTTWYSTVIKLLTIKAIK